MFYQTMKFLNKYEWFEILHTIKIIWKLIRWQARISLFDQIHNFIEWMTLQKPQKKNKNETESAHIANLSMIYGHLSVVRLEMSNQKYK